MKRLLIWALMATICVVVPEMAQAQKTVTYTFKGRAQGWILPAKPIDLVASGAVPAGVTVSNIYITKDAYDNDVENEYVPGDERIDDVDMDGFLGSALLTEYVVQPSTTAHIHFDGFRYQIADIEWNRCSEIAILTSKGTTTARDYLNGAIGSFAFSTAGEEGYSTGGELFYHTREFLPGFDYGTSSNKVKGLSMLVVDCTSKQAQHGIAIKNFNIKYYEPVISFSGNASRIETIGQKNTIVATITDHRGAFTNEEIKYKSSNPEYAEIIEEGGAIKVKANKAGKATITAYIEYGGAVVAKASYSVQVFMYLARVSLTMNWDLKKRFGLMEMERHTHSLVMAQRFLQKAVTWLQTLVSGRDREHIVS